jgi:hypothetical protein
MQAGDVEPAHAVLAHVAEPHGWIGGASLVIPQTKNRLEQNQGAVGYLAGWAAIL